MTSSRLRPVSLARSEVCLLESAEFPDAGTATTRLVFCTTVPAAIYGCGNATRNDIVELPLTVACTASWCCNDEGNKSLGTTLSSQRRCDIECIRPKVIYERQENRILSQFWLGGTANGSHVIGSQPCDACSFAPTGRAR